MCNACQGVCLHLVCSSQQCTPFNCISSPFSGNSISPFLCSLQISENFISTVRCAFFIVVLTLRLLGQLKPRWGGTWSQWDGFWGVSWIHAVLRLTFFFKSRPLKPFHSHLKEHEYYDAKHSMGALLLWGAIFSMWSISRSAAKWLLPGVPKRQPVQELCFVGQHIPLIAGFPATDWSLQPLAGFTSWSCR